MSLLVPNIGRRIRETRGRPLTALTPQTLATALDLFEAGHLRQAALLWEQMEQRDDTLKIAAAKRRKAVSQRPWAVLTTEKSDEAERHAAALTWLYNHCTALNAADENEAGGFALLVRQMMDCALTRYAAHELVWQPGGEGVTDAGVRFPQITFEARFVPLYFFENITGRLRYIGPLADRAEGLDLPEGEWMISAGDGIMRAAAICYTFKRLSLHDWINFSEKFGSPGIHGETGAAPGSTEWDNFVDALDAFANDWVCATSTGTKINLIEASRTGEAPFEPMVERMDRRMVALCRGADLSTMSSAEGAGASLQGGEGDLLITDDCALISETLQRFVSRHAIRALFGTEPLAYIQLQPPQDADAMRDIAVDTFLTSHGVRISASEASERYGRALAEEGEPALVPPAAPAALPPAGPPPPRFAANDALAEITGILPTAFAPVKERIEKLIAAAKDGRMTAEEFATQAEAIAATMPDLLTPELVAEVAAPIEAAMGGAVIEGVRSTLKKPTKQPTP